MLAAAIAAIARLSATGGIISTVRDLDEHLCSSHGTEQAFDVQGTVLKCCSRQDKNFVLCSGTNIVMNLVDKAHWPRLPFVNGDVVRASGYTMGFMRANCQSIQLVQHGPPPQPQSVNVRDLLASHRTNKRFVRVKGLVRDFFSDDIDPMYASLVLTGDESILYLSLRCVPEDQSRLRQLVNAVVEVDGIYQPARLTNQAANGSTRLLGPTLCVASAADFRITRPAPDDPFDLPDLATLRPAGPSALALAPRCRIHGRVITAARPGGFLLKTRYGRIVNVDLMDGPSPRTGETVVAAGLPATDLYRINLVRAIWKKIQDDSDWDESSPPEGITAEQLLTDGAGHAEYKVDRHGTRVRLRGSVSSLPAPGNADARLLLDCNGHTIALVADPGSNPFEGLGIGYAIEVTGVCLMDIEQWQPDRALPVVRGVSVAVRSAADIRILARSSWWTPLRLFVLVCILAALATGIAVWNVSLNALVVRRSRELLRAQAERLKETLRVGERTRLATELHDTVAQNLSGLSLQLDAAVRLADTDPAAMKRILSFSSKALLACRREIRECLWDLRSRALDEPNMDDAIRKALAPHLGVARLVTRFNVPRRKIADQTAHAVLRILGELVGNAMRHGKAESIRIAGVLDNGVLTFSCQDDGCGFETKCVQGAENGHFGLQGIRDRIRAGGGTFEIASKPGHGTRAVVTLEVAAQEDLT